jgi:hypothetical protein
MQRVRNDAPTIVVDAEHFVGNALGLPMRKFAWRAISLSTEQVGFNKLTLERKGKISPGTLKEI